MLFCRFKATVLSENNFLVFLCEQFASFSLQGFYSSYVIVTTKFEYNFT